MKPRSSREFMHGMVGAVRAFDVRAVASQFRVMLLMGLVSVVFSMAVLHDYHAPSLSCAVLSMALWLVSGGALVAVRRARVREVESRCSAIIEERTRVAREIHDTLLQGFAGVTLMVVAVAREVRDPAQAAALQHVVDLSEKTLREARHAVWDLRDPSEESDLVTAIRAEADDAVKETGLRLDFVVDGPPRPIDPHTTTVMLRVTREAITNAVRHANATRLRVRLSFHPHVVRLSVRDDGIGFTVDRDFRVYGRHWGLRGMWERAAQIGAALRVNSKPGAGTEVVLSVLPPSRKLKKTRVA
jgi:signal transduction histidine kinase